ncbi:hypothetical protein SPH9361_00487 [Sphingobium sp. CECT 9361]|nr:hypothetical protein SPH9361_00487 [Sphingobium sp. CECT 9361]
MLMHDQSTNQRADPADMAEVERLKALMLKKPYFMMTRTMLDPARMPEVMLQHYRWVIGLEKANKILLSGPVSDKAGKPGAGVTIFRAESFEEAEAMADADPFVSFGAVTYTMQRWQLNEGRITLQFDLSDQSCVIS